MGEVSCSNLSNPAHFRKAILAQKWKQETSEPRFRLRYCRWQPLFSWLQIQEAKDFPGVLKGIKIMKHREDEKD